MKMFLFFLKTLLWGWLLAIIELWRLLCRVLKRFCRPKRKIPSRHRCIPINNPAFVRPDPMIYDQYYLTSLGLAVTWDNPDIQLYLNGTPVSSDQLLVGTTYEVVAQIWNNSTDAPVVGMPVAFSFLEFGVGTISVPIGSTQCDLGVKGGPNCPTYASMLWTTPATPGHYCIQVLLQPADDTNPLNNLGQENTNVGTAHSPAVFTFTLRNDTDKQQTYNWVVDAYVPAPPDPCGSTNSAADRAARVARNRRGLQPVPPGWQLTVVPETPTLDPDQSTVITVTAQPPAGFNGNQVLNVNAFHAGGIAGGVTLTVQVT
ncbi:MAG: hypothetical protein JO051_02235 [Acidobacteriaceae bacterium]|nr:hypothetical protein [Acidobacteriaceae bacterium]